MDAFITKHRLLIKEEHDYELQEIKSLIKSCTFKELQEKGLCLTRLQVSHHCTGLYGRTIVTFESKNGSQSPLPSHSITNGEIVGVIVNSRSAACSVTTDLKNDLTGIVIRVHPRYVNVAFDVQDHSSSSLLWSLEEKHDVIVNLVKLANDVTYKRLKSCLDSLHKSSPTSLANVLFGEGQPADPLPCFTYKDGKEIEFINKNLNGCQREAVSFALKQKDLAIIHGPPGTGKTTAIVEIVVQAVLCGQKVLACAPSNIAVDNLIERLVEHKKVQVVRLGHPARAMKNLHKYSLDAIISNSSYSADVVGGVRKEIDANLLLLRKTKDTQKRQHIQRELKVLRKELFYREKNCMKQVLQEANVILSTLTSASKDGPLKNLLEPSDNNHFDFVVIDECSQAIEVSCWIALAYSKKCVLAGDHLQLPPTILCDKAARNGLDVSLMQRLLDDFRDHNNLIMRMLTVQYRMNFKIMDWPSKQLYNGQLKADPSVTAHLVTDLEGVDQNDHTDSALVLIDTAGCDLHELDVADDMSKANAGEVDLVAIHVEMLVSSGVDPSCIGIISPYNLQVELLKIKMNNRYGNKIEIKSIDSFQGREKEIIVLSLVRSNNRREVGFLSENRRINVAITRARRQLSIVCDSQTVSNHPFLESLMNYVMEHGKVMSAAMFDLYNQKSSREETLFLDKVKTKSEIRLENTSAKNKKNSEKKQTQISINETGPVKQLVEDANSKQNREELIKKNMEELINAFVQNSQQKSKEFPVDLSSYERMLVHQFCEKLGLNHESCGEGRNRHIVIQKKECTARKDLSDDKQLDNGGYPEDTFKGSPELTSDFFEASEDFHEAPSAISGLTDTVKCNAEMPNDVSDLQRCTNCDKEIPKPNFMLHQVRCHNIDTNSTTQKQAKNTKSLQKQLGKADEEDIDSLVSVIVKVDNTCSFHKCNHSVKLLGQKCTHCGRTFCLTHCTPEFHGCGMAAKLQARNQMRADMNTSLNSNSVSGKKSVPRPALEKKLEDKLKKMSSSRGKRK